MNEKEILQKIYENLEYDGWGYWMPEWCVSPNTKSRPSYEDFIKCLTDDSDIDDRPYA